MADSCRVRQDEFRAHPVRLSSGMTSLHFGPLPQGSTIVDLEWDDGAAVLTVEVPDPEGPLVCGCDECLECGAGVDHG